MKGNCNHFGKEFKPVVILVLHKTKWSEGFVFIFIGVVCLLAEVIAYRNNIFRLRKDS